MDSYTLFQVMLQMQPMAWIASLPMAMKCSTFYTNCSELANDIIPIVHESFMFAAKCVKAPYKTPVGPDVISIDMSRNGPGSNIISFSVAVSDEDYIVPHAIFDEGVKSQNIAKVHLFVDMHPDDEWAEAIMLEAEDGAFDSVSEVAVMEFDTSAWEDGSKHIFYFQISAISAIFVERSMDAKESTVSAPVSTEFTPSTGSTILLKRGMALFTLLMPCLFLLLPN